MKIFNEELMEALCFNFVSLKSKTLVLESNKNSCDYYYVLGKRHLSEYAKTMTLKFKIRKTTELDWK